MKTTETSPDTLGGVPPSPRKWRDGFTFVEILVAAAISAVTIAVAALAYSAITARSPSLGQVKLTLPSGLANSYYGLTNNVVSVGIAPSMGEIGRAEAMREILEEDLRKAVFTVCLARSDASTYTYRPTSISPGLGFSGKQRIRPSEFRAFIGSNSSSFLDYKGAATNASGVALFVFQASTNSSLNVRAIYESDVIPISSPVGLYGSVRRYSGGLLTDYYHVFYEGKQNTSDSTITYDGSTNTSFSPPVVYFDRTISTDATNSPAPFRQAPHSPFYFLWWPDPARFNPLNESALVEETDPLQPRFSYWSMAYRTSYFFVIPAIPSL